MTRSLLFIAIFFAGICCARAQFGSFGDLPVEITSESTHVENGLAIAEDNVFIRYSDTAIYCDYAQYNPETRDVFLSGNVRIYRDNHLFNAERALYNLETKVLNMADFTGETLPFRFAGSSISTLGPNSYIVKNGVFTTSDSSKPDYTIRAKTVRIYPKDRVIFSNVTLYIGRVPIFWYPYLYQSLNQDTSFTFTPGYSSTFGAYLLNQYSFPVGDSIEGRVRLDLMDLRGVGIGVDGTWGRLRRQASPIVSSATNLAQGPSVVAAPEVKGNSNFGRLVAYYIDDRAPGTNTTALGRDVINSNRYRASISDRTYLAEDIYSTVDINKLSDRYFLQDYYPQTFSRNPNPDNFVALTKWDEDYTLTLILRKQLNTLFDTTERTPGFSVDVKRQPLFNWPLFYDSDSNVAELKRAYANDSGLMDYQAFRADTYHQLSLPETFFGWLNVIPHVGVRGTYYNQTSPTDSIRDPETGVVTTTARDPGPTFRAAFTANLETSFKLTRAYEEIQSRALGLDGLNHVIQPYIDASMVRVNIGPDRLLQFDQYNPSTEAPILDFPQFNTIDSLDNWNIIRFGIRNFIQTRRDDQTFNWLELNTFMDLTIGKIPTYGSTLPVAEPGMFSNLHNQMILAPLPWFYYRVSSQTPIIDRGFTQVNSDFSFVVNKNVNLTVGQRYIWGNQEFTNTDLWNVSAYVRLGDNWAFSVSESYDFAIRTLESQTYQIHRDLSSWTAALGFNVLNNGGVNQITFLLTFTVKDAPSIRTPFSYTENALTNN